MGPKVLVSRCKRETFYDKLWYSCLTLLSLWLYGVSFSRGNQELWVHQVQLDHQGGEYLVPRWVHVVLTEITVTVHKNWFYWFTCTSDLYQGEPGPQGPAGPVGEPGVGLPGPKVSSALMTIYWSSHERCKQHVIIVCRVTEGHLDLLGHLVWKVKASRVFQWVSAYMSASFIRSLPPSCTVDFYHLVF